jgi:hypothetical protein
MGRATVDFQSFVDRLPDRGEAYTPIAILLSYGHGTERSSFTCKMLGVYPEDIWDIELRELFNVLWYPTGVVEGQPQAPDLQSMPNGMYGNIFDVLVDRPTRAKAMLDYPVVVVGGDANLAPMISTVNQYLAAGGTLVINVAACTGLPPAMLGITLTGATVVASEWIAGNFTSNSGSYPTTPYEISVGTLAPTAEVLAADGAASNANPVAIRNQVGAGAVILTLVPHMIGIDERAHPAMPWLMNGLTENLLPVEVLLAASGKRPTGEIMYQVNKAKQGYVVTLMNNFGVDKTQTGLARVDRSKYVDVLLRTVLPIKTATEYTQSPPRMLEVQQVTNATVVTTTVSLRVTVGDIQVVSLV